MLNNWVLIIMHLYPGMRKSLSVVADSLMTWKDYNVKVTKWYVQYNPILLKIIHMYMQRKIIQRLINQRLVNLSVQHYFYFVLPVPLSLSSPTPSDFISYLFIKKKGRLNFCLLIWQTLFQKTIHSIGKDLG